MLEHKRAVVSGIAPTLVSRISGPPDKPGFLVWCCCTRAPVAVVASECFSRCSELKGFPAVEDETSRARPCWIETYGMNPQAPRCPAAHASVCG